VKDYRGISLVSQGKRNHNIRGIWLDCSSEILQENGLKNDRNFKGWNLLEIDII
jgi:hypothetical protein